MINVKDVFRNSCPLPKKKFCLAKSWFFLKYASATHCTSANIIRMINWVRMVEGNVALMGADRDLGERIEGKSPTARTWRRRQNNIKIDFQKEVKWKTWTGLLWFGQGTDGGCFSMMYHIFGFRKMWGGGIFWLFAGLFISQDGLCSKYVVTQRHSVRFANYFPSQWIVDSRLSCCQ